MALYTPQSQRRRRLAILVVVAFLLGGILGVFAGRLTAPTSADQVADVQEHARQISAQLRVLSLHVQAGAVSLGVGGDGGAGFALQRADEDLTQALEQAPWIMTERGDALRARLRELEHGAGTNASTASFAADVEGLAGDIDHTFGLTTPP